MCYNNCSYFNRYTERSTCRRGRDGLLPCEREEAERDDDDLTLDSELVKQFWHSDRQYEEPRTLAEALAAVKLLHGDCYVS